MPSKSFTDFEMLRKGQTEYITIFCRDPATEDLTDVVGTSTFSLVNLSDDSTILSESFTAGGSTHVEHPAVGTYQYVMNTTTYPDEYVAFFRCVLSGEVVNNNIYTKAVSAKYFAYAAQLRSIVDKARKNITDQIENMDRLSSEPKIDFYYGVSDPHLMSYLERGISMLNIIPPYTNLTVDTFPFTSYSSVLLDAATLAYAVSQGIFAIDTDFNYSLGGNSFVIDHFTKLNAFWSAFIANFTKSATSFKAQYRSKGTVLYCWMPGGVRSARLLTALPSTFFSRLYSAAMV
jgi:hypothetical protein